MSPSGLNCSSEISDCRNSRIRTTFPFLADSHSPLRSGGSRSSHIHHLNTSQTNLSPIDLQSVEAISVVPYERNHYFTGRTPELKEVRQLFRESGKDHHRIALHGLGGIGKTQFALEYLFRFGQDYDNCFWITGSERASYISELAMLAEKLKFSRSRPNLTPMEIASELLRWLPQLNRWLLVIDNLEDVEVLKNLMPSGTICGHILITTRNANLRSLPARTYRLQEMCPDEAAQLLIHRAIPDCSDDDILPRVRDEARLIVEELGCLPLAIEQAARYIQQSLDGIFDFRSIYQSNQRRILDRPGSLEYSKSVSTTWLLSFEMLKRKCPDALTLLNLFAFLNPDDILVDFLRAGIGGLSEHVKSLVTDPYKFDELLAALSDYSLIHLFQGKKSLSMHRLVQAVIKDRLSPGERIQWRNITLQICAIVFPQILEKEISLHRQFYQQVMACINGTDIEDSELAAEIMSRLGWYWDREAQYSDAAALYERSIAMYQRCQDEENECRYIVMDRLGWTYMRQSRKAESIKLFKESLSALRRILGDEHDRTLSCQRNFAVALLRGASKAEGMAMLEAACVKQRRVLGDNDPRSHATMRKLASAYMDHGRTKDATTLLEIVYTSSKRTKNASFQSVQCELGWAYSLQNRLSEGERLLQSAYERQCETLGEEHPNTLKITRHLACGYFLQGRISEGIALLEKTCDNQRSQMGLENEETLLSMRYLAGAYHCYGISGNARAIELTEVLKERELEPITWIYSHT